MTLKLFPVAMLICAVFCSSAKAQDGLIDTTDETSTPEKSLDADNPCDQATAYYQAAEDLAASIDKLGKIQDQCAPLDFSCLAAAREMILQSIAQRMAYYAKAAQLAMAVSCNGLQDNKGNKVKVKNKKNKKKTTPSAK